MLKLCQAWPRLLRSASSLPLPLAPRWAELSSGSLFLVPVCAAFNQPLCFASLEGRGGELAGKTESAQQASLAMGRERCCPGRDATRSLQSLLMLLCPHLHLCILILAGFGYLKTIPASQASSLHSPASALTAAGLKDALQKG